jgi:hypothetical protein
MPYWHLGAAKNDACRFIDEYLEFRPGDRDRFYPADT